MKIASEIDKGKTEPGAAAEWSEIVWQRTTSHGLFVVYPFQKNIAFIVQRTAFNTDICVPTR